MKLTEQQKEIALEVAEEMPCCMNMVDIDNGVVWTKSELLEFAARFLAALPKPKPVAWTTKGQIAAMENGFQHYIQGRVPRFVQPCTDDVPLYTTPPQPDDVRDAERYRELIMAVERKFPNESRHETALRYIKAGERKTKVVDAGMAKVALRQAKGD